MSVGPMDERSSGLDTTDVHFWGCKSQGHALLGEQAVFNTNDASLLSDVQLTAEVEVHGTNIPQDYDPLDTVVWLERLSDDSSIPLPLRDGVCWAGLDMAYVWV